MPFAAMLRLTAVTSPMLIKKSTASNSCRWWWAVPVLGVIALKISPLAAEEPPSCVKWALNGDDYRR